ncbi:E3 ubiquitin-protein ligase hrd1 [Sporothrix bragantina]|uniref:RING-type E3 ubiquitin transferase n=1 Tax=Sporothrix bragantina TaxID=671064 RepID=A0ABP0BNC1_9PEZI
MRLAWYAGASTALAGGVVLSAFHQRANFYSAMVYLYQSNLCMMILVNLIALVYSSFVYSLQRVCFGQLRAIEVEQLYEKAWFAVTETCLAMTIFRDEIGGFFIVMFVALLTGKVWGWIGEGRIEALEQQPPANPRLFHTRLIISLCLSLIYDAWLLYYAVTTVIDQARPDMMVMFLFEFAVLLITSLHTALRYSIILLDTSIVKRQTQERLQERRRQVREEREAILRRREEAKAAAEAAAAMSQEGAEEALAAVEQEDDEPLPDEDDVDEMDIEVAGWEAKGQYILGLDLWTDFTKLCIYAVFFFVLLRFYGLPLHIIRDLFMTIRSFIKRLGALMKYRQAIKDMNRYEDASEEDLARENTCIICREDMHVWVPNDRARIERTRPKKLPCGHILHLGCLKSWMERQQVCPTCRRSVVIDDASNANRNRDAIFRLGLGNGAAAAAAPGAAAPGAGAGPGAGPGMAPAPGPDGVRPPPIPEQQAILHANGLAPAPAAGAPVPGHAGHANLQPPPPRANGAGLRMFNLGPLRLGFAQGRAPDIQEMAQRLGFADGFADGLANNNGGANFAAPGAAHHGAGIDPPSVYHGAQSMSTSTSTASIFQDLQAIEQRIERGTLELQVASAEAQTLRAMLMELQRIRIAQNPDNENAEPAQVPAQPPVEETPALGTEQAPAAAATEHTEASPSGAPTTTEPESQAPQVTDDATPPAPAAAQDTAPVPFQQPPQGFAEQAQRFGPAQAFSQRYIIGQSGGTRPFTFARGGQAQPGVGQAAGNAPGVAVHMMPDATAPAIPAGSTDLPPYVQIPAGWSLLPLQRFDNSTLAALNTNRDNAGGNANGTTDDGASTWQFVNPSQAGPSNSSGATDEEDSASADATAQQGSSEQSLQATAEDVSETAAASPSSSAPPTWGGSAQMFGNSGSQENASAASPREAGNDS